MSRRAGYRKSLRPLESLKSLALVALLVTHADFSSAQVIFDGSIGPPGPAPTRTDLPGFDLDTLITYDAGLAPGLRRGAIAGSNLYQSLSELSILQPDGTRTSATFQALDAMGNRIPLDNVIARVTGTNASLIEGVLRSEIPGANLYLLNPNGVMFTGVSALENQLDVPASFFVSTADSLRFSNGDEFVVAELASPTLSAAEPAAFGFLGGDNGDVILDLSLMAPRTQRASITIVAGDVRLQNESLIEVAGGTIQVAAVGDAANEVPISLDAWSAMSANVPLGAVDIREDSDLRNASLADAEPQGRVVLRGGRLVIDESLVTAGGNAGVTENALDVEMAESIVARSDSRLQVSGSSSAGVGGGRLVTSRLEVLGTGTRVGVRTAGSAAAADFVVEADDVLVADDGILTTEARQSSPGGTLVVDAGTIEVRDGGRLESATLFGTAVGGKLDIKADTLLVTRSNPTQEIGLVRSISNNGGPGGAIEILADSITIEQRSLISSSAGTRAPGGSMTIEAGSLTLQSGGQITSTTLTNQDAGALTIQETGAITIVGSDRDLNQPSGIFARTGSPDTGGGIGNAGRLVIEAASLSMSGNAAISTRSFGPGNSGALELVADEFVELASTSGGTPEISARALDGDAGGDLLIRTGTLELLGGAAVSNSTFGTSPAGTLRVFADEARIEGRDAAGNRSELLSESADDLGSTPGAGGSIQVVVEGSLSIRNGGRISARSRGLGDAGNVGIAAGRLLLKDGSITTEADDAAGGNIEIDATEAVELVEGSVATSVLGREGDGNAGNITIRAPNVVVNASEVLAQAILGDGGDILIEADAFLESVDSLISASSELGISGEKQLPPPDNTLQTRLSQPEPRFLEAAALLREHCAARSAQRSSFVVGGRDGVAENPRRPLPARMPLPATAGASDHDANDPIDSAPEWAALSCPPDSARGGR